MEEAQSKRNDFSLKANRNSIIVIWNDSVNLNITPFIKFLIKKERIGKISDMNIACAKLFGYFKEDLINRDLKVNFLMPDIFANKHDGFLRQFHTSQDPENKNLFYKSKLVYGKHKSRYIFPIRLRTRVVPSKKKKKQNWL